MFMTHLIYAIVTGVLAIANLAATFIYAKRDFGTVYWNAGAALVCSIAALYHGYAIFF